MSFLPLPLSFKMSSEGCLRHLFLPVLPVSLGDLIQASAFSYISDAGKSHPASPSSFPFSVLGILFPTEVSSACCVSHAFPLSSPNPSQSILQCRRPKRQADGAKAAQEAQSDSCLSVIKKRPANPGTQPLLKENDFS